MRFVLMTANFAPRSGSHPTRTVHLTKYLHDLGHEVKVVTYAESQHALYASADTSLAAKVPPAVEVRRIPASWLHRWLGAAKRQGHQTSTIKRRATRHPATALLVPDPHCLARGAFVQAGLEIVRSWKPHVVVTCAYPFTLTLVGADIRRQSPDIVWIADYGDPWTGSPVTELRLPAWRRKLDARLESRALDFADAVTVTTEPTARLYRDQFPDIGGRVHVVTMGYDPADAADIAPKPRAAEDKGMTVLLHAGRLYSEARDPEPFIAAVDACLAADPEAAARLKIVLLGEVEPAIEAAIRRSRAAALYEFHGWVTVEESLARMKAADALLLFGNSGNMQIPGKVYQYIGTGRPVFMTCDSDRDPTADVLRQYGRDTIVPNIEADLVIALRKLLEGAPPPGDGEAACEQFSWPVLAARLADIAASARARSGKNAAEAGS